MNSLEPVIYKKNTVLIEELEHFSQVIFFTKGQYQIGMTLEYDRHFFSTKLKNTVIGGVEASFNKRSIAIYKTHT